MSGADEWNRAMDAIERADAKRARKAAKREEDARRSAEGRAWSKNVVDVWSPPHTPRGTWDEAERWWRGSGHVDGWSWTPRWRARLNHRRSLPWVGPSWLGSEVAWRRWNRRVVRMWARGHREVRS